MAMVSLDLRAKMRTWKVCGIDSSDETTNDGDAHAHSTLVSGHQRVTPL